MSTLTGPAAGPLVLGALLIGAALLLSGLLRREVITRPDAWWSSELAVGSLFGPLAAGSTAFGVAFLVLGALRWQDHPPSIAAIAIAAGTFAGSLLVARLMQVAGRPEGEPAPLRLVEGTAQVEAATAPSSPRKRAA